nr:MAG TPA: hypothetical protein [Bacteriophage sp.]
MISCERLSSWSIIALYIRSRNIVTSSKWNFIDLWRSSLRTLTTYSNSITRSSTYINS